MPILWSTTIKMNTKCELTLHKHIWTHWCSKHLLSKIYSTPWQSNGLDCNRNGNSTYYKVKYNSYLNIWHTDMLPALKAHQLLHCASELSNTLDKNFDIKVITWMQSNVSSYCVK